MGWDTRLAWSGEQPADTATLLQRFETVTGSGATRTAVDATGRNWTIRNFAGSAPLDHGRWGQRFTFNENAPATERTSLTVPHFAGMWPSSGQVLLVAWAALRYAMGFTPIISTRNTTGKTPLVYLSTMADGRPRAQVYGAAGSLVVDQAETLPWSTTIGAWVCYMMHVDLDNRTSQIAVVRHTQGDAHIAPKRNLSGAANPACEADFEALTLSLAASYWANGRIDEIGLWHPEADFDFPAFVEQVRLSTWAGGADEALGAGLHVTDQQVTAQQAATLHTGAEQRAWVAPQPTPAPYEALSGQPRALLSADGGTTWTEPLAPSELPETFDGLVRWQIPLEQGETFRGLDLVEQQPVPTLDQSEPVEITQHDATTIRLTGRWIGTPQIHIVGSPALRTVVEGTSITIASGLDAGTHAVTVSVTDDTGQTSEPMTITVTVTVLPWEPPEAPEFAKATLIIHNAQGEREAVVDDPVEAQITREVNGAETLTFALPVNHPKARWMVNERTVEAAGQNYRIRKLTTTRDTSGTPIREAFCEATWYDLRVAGRVRERAFTGAQAGQALEYVLEGKGWTIAAVNVTTRRTWTMENQTTLAALRAIADVHGGDLVLDGEAKTVSLLTFAGRDRGVAFFHGQALSEATRVEDTTNLITRIEPRNEEGVGIESVNGGVPYLEDFSYTPEVRHGVYNFASGTSPQTMMAMTVAAIGKRAFPAVSYEATVADLSAWSGQEIDRFDAGDRVLIVDQELGIETVQRIVAMEYDLLRPWESKVTLSEKLRELGSSDSSTEAGVLDTGADIDTRDLVPFNLLRNARFDNGLAHWAASGVQVVDGGVTGSRAARLGQGTRWLEQTVATDTRETYTFSMQVEHRGGPQQWIPDLAVVAEVTFDDGSTETITLDLT